MKIRAGLLAVLVAATLMGCSSTSQTPAGPQTQTIEVSYEEFQAQKQLSRSVTIQVGDSLRISLASNPSTGYQWSEKLLISQPTVLVQTGHQTLPSTTDRPGAAGTQVWTLEAKAPGNTTVSGVYGRPWPGGEKDAWVFSANVTVD